jgi:GAF domain-containing protein
MNADPTTADGPRDAGADIRRESRLAALRETGLLDTPPEEVFDRVTRLARSLLRAPVILVSLVDADRQFFKGAAACPSPG